MCAYVRLLDLDLLSGVRKFVNDASWRKRYVCLRARVCVCALVCCRTSHHLDHPPLAITGG
jgi:hypothetical protein